MAFEVMNADPIAVKNRGNLEPVYKALEDATNLARDVEIIVGRIVGISRDGEKADGSTNVKVIATSVIDELNEQASKTMAAIAKAKKSSDSLAQAFGV